MVVKKTQAELLAVAATQLERATAATTTLLDRNDERVQSLSERVSILETKIDSAHSRLKNAESVLFGTLADSGLKERFHYVETEIKRIQQFLNFVDTQFKTGMIKNGRLAFWTWANPTIIVFVAVAVTLILVSVGMLVWKRYFAL